MGNCTIFQMFENPRRGRKARNFTTMFRKFQISLIVFRTDIFRKLSSGAPDHFEISVQKFGKSVRLVRDQGFHSLITCPSGINLFEIPDQYIFNKLILLPEKTTCSVPLSMPVCGFRSNSWLTRGIENSQEPIKFDRLLEFEKQGRERQAC